MKTELFAAPFTGVKEFDQKGFWVHPDGQSAWTDLAPSTDRFVDWVRGQGFDAVVVSPALGSDRHAAPLAFDSPEGWILVHAYQGCWGGLYVRPARFQMPACPFCGGAPGPVGRDQVAVVVCRDCGAEGPLVRVSAGDPVQRADAIREAVRLWALRDTRNAAHYERAFLAGLCAFSLGGKP